MPGLVDRATPDERLLMVSRQLDAIQENPEINTIGCPYCGTFTVEGDTFCCQALQNALMALLDARDKVRELQRMRRN
jgi:hypothetical protein